jgi:hypothetical protein
VLVVSNIDLTTDSRVIKPATFLEATIKEPTLNINNDYRYLKTGYYVSLHAEVLGNRVIPSCENIIDSSRTPILLLRAAKAGIPTLPFVVTDSVKKIISELGFPVLVFAVNPFIHDGYKTATNKSALYRAMKCREDAEAAQISKQVYELFKIPVCKLHIQKVEGKAFLCGLQTVGKEELSLSDLELISREVSLISEQGEPFSV